MNELLTSAKDEVVDEMKAMMDTYISHIPGIERASSPPVLDANTLTEQAFCADWVSENKPCLIKGAVAHWPAVEKWRCKEYWLSSCSNFDVGVYPHSNFNNADRHNIGHEKMFFHDAIERLYQEKDHTFSMPSEQIVEGKRFWKLKADIGDFKFLRSAKMPRIYERTRFFIYRRAATAWHYHNIDETLMCQVNGTKRVALLPPDIPSPRHVTDFLVNEVYLDAIELDKSLNLKPLVVDVEEGDALYIPPYWHHVVVPTGGEVGFTVAYCWRSPLHILGDFSNFFVRTLYMQAMFPPSIRTLWVPFLAVYAGIRFYTRKFFMRKQGF